MKKITFALAAIAAVMGSAAPAMAAQQPDGAVSVQLGTNDIAGTRVSQLGLSAQTMVGGYLGTVSMAVGNNHGVNARSLDVSVGRVFSLSQHLAMAPTVELGYDKAGVYQATGSSAPGVFSAKHVAVGVDAVDRLGNGFSLNGGVRLGRSFGTSAGFSSGTYAGADVGVAYHVGDGQVGVSYGFKSMPMYASNNVDERSINVGYTAYF